MPVDNELDVTSRLRSEDLLEKLVQSADKAYLAGRIEDCEAMIKKIYEFFSEKHLLG